MKLTGRCYLDINNPLINYQFILQPTAVNPEVNLCALLVTNRKIISCIDCYSRGIIIQYFLFLYF